MPNRVPSGFTNSILFPLINVHTLLFLSIFVAYTETRRRGNDNPTAYIKSNNPPLNTEPVPEASTKIATRIGPTQGVHEMPRPVPNNNEPI